MKITIFDEIIDEREQGKVIHDLQDILTITLFAVLSGAEDYEMIVEYGNQKLDFLRKEFEILEAGVPSVSTFQRVFHWLSPFSLVNYFEKNLEEVLRLRKQYLLNIDGKVLRGTVEKGKRNSGICVLTAWAQEQNLVLGQLKVDSKSNEKTAMPQLLENLDLQGAIVSADAMMTTREIAEKIVKKKGDYILAVKKNKKGLYREVEDWLGRKRSDFETYKYTDYVGGRIEERSYVVCRDLQHLHQDDLLANSQSVIKVTCKRTTKKKSTTETRYYISSLSCEAKQFADYIKGHWSIENQLHWHLDVSFHEDESRIRTGNSAENMSIIRKMALQMLKKMKDKASIKRRRMKAAWNNDYLIKVLQTALS